MSLTLKISTAILSIIVFALSLLVFLTYFKYESTLAQLVRSRFLVIASDIKNTVHRGLSLGVTLSELQGIQEVIEEAKNNHPHILSIKVFEFTSDDQAKTVYNTRLAGIGGNIPELWLRTMLISKKAEEWYLKGEEANVIGVPIVNNFGKHIGGIAIRYSQHYIHEQSVQMLNNLLRKLSLILTAVSLFVLVGSYLLFYPISKSFSRMSNLLESYINRGQIPSHNGMDELEESLINTLKKNSMLLKKLENLKHLMSLSSYQEK